MIKKNRISRLFATIIFQVLKHLGFLLFRVMCLLTWCMQTVVSTHFHYYACHLLICTKYTELNDIVTKDCLPWAITRWYALVTSNVVEL